jgi:hypothetical protein
MDFFLETLTKKMTKKPAVDLAFFEKTFSKLDFQMPVDYLEFIKGNNGGEGFVGENNYLNLWSIEDLINWNDNYKVDLYAPGYFIFASDGGGTAYAFAKKDGEIVAFQFVGMLMEDEPVILGKNFRSFLEYLFRN